MKFRSSAWVFNVILIACLGVTASRWFPHLYKYAQRSIYDSSAIEVPGHGSILPGDALNPGRRFIALALSSKCPTCQKSAGLYRAIAHRLKNRPDWQLVVLADHRDDGLRHWLDAQGIRTDKLVRIRFSGAGIWGTPSLFVGNERGVIEDLKVGSLNALNEDRLWQMLDGSPPPLFDNSSRPGRIPVSAARSRLSAGQLQVVDTNPRGLFWRTWSSTQAKVIPIDELGARSSVELSKALPVAIDCRRHAVGLCFAAATALYQQGYASVDLVASR